jgi:hypothetical protein
MTWNEDYDFHIISNVRTNQTIRAIPSRNPTIVIKRLASRNVCRKVSLKGMLFKRNASPPRLPHPLAREITKEQAEKDR